MAKKNLKPNDVVVKITFDMELDGKKYKDIVLEYKPEKDWCLTWEDLHWEDNDSWNCVDVEDMAWDFQITGEDDDLGMKSPIHIDGNNMYQEYRDEEGRNDTWSHGDDWLSYHNVKFTKVKIHTKDGKCELIKVVNY